MNPSIEFRSVSGTNVEAEKPRGNIEYRATIYHLSVRTVVCQFRFARFLAREWMHWNSSIYCLKRMVFHTFINVRIIFVKVFHYFSAGCLHMRNICWENGREKYDVWSLKTDHKWCMKNSIEQCMELNGIKNKCFHFHVACKPHFSFYLFRSLRTHLARLCELTEKLCVLRTADFFFFKLAC